MRAERAIPIIASLLIAATGALALFSIYAMTVAPGSSGGVRSGISIGGPFALTDDSGRQVTDADYAGRAHLVFFGFTHCPDICPTKLSEASIVLETLGEDAGKLDVLFITVDPGRDTPEVLHDYISNFHPQITALTGSDKQIADVARAFRAYYKKVPLDGGGDYTMDHSTVVYLFDRKGDFIGPVSLDRDPAELAEQLRAYL